MHIHSIVKRLRELITQYEYEAAELSNGLVATCLGIWLLLPFDTFGSGQVFASLRSVGVPEWVYGIALLMLGVGEYVGLVANVWVIRRYTVYLTALIWFAFMLMFGYSTLAAMAPVLFFCLWITACWSYWRLGMMKPSTTTKRR